MLAAVNRRVEPMLASERGGLTRRDRPAALARVAWSSLPTGPLHVRAAPASSDGRREPAVMVHGLGGAATNWTDVMGLLRDRLHCLAPDLPGFGWSPPPTGRRLLARGRTRGPSSSSSRRPTAARCTCSATRSGGTVATVVAATRPDLVRTPDPGVAGAARCCGRAPPTCTCPRWRCPGPGSGWPGGSAGSRSSSGCAPPSRSAGPTRRGCRRAGGGGDGRGRAAGPPRARRRRDDPVAAQPDGGLPAPGPLAAVAARRHGCTAPTLLVYGLRTGWSTRAPRPARPRTFPDSRLVVLPDSGHVVADGAPRGGRPGGTPAARRGAGQACGWPMLTIQLMPNLSTHMPNSSPHICFSSGTVDGAAVGELLPVAAQLVGVVATEAHRDVVAGVVLLARRGVGAHQGRTRSAPPAGSA